MDVIKDSVIREHISRFPDERVILDKFVPDFDITWGSDYRLFNAPLLIYYLRAKQHIQQTFGFEQEVVLAISSYTSLQARAIQAIDQICQELPARGRVDQTVALVVSSASDTESWLLNYTAQNPQSRVYVGVSKSDICASNDPWFIRNRLLRQLFSRDLFDYSLPLDSDLFFFGRTGFIQDHIDAIRRSENRGIFGLRKTGKTSVLFKLERMCEAAGISSQYYDCKLPSLYRLSADEMLDRISVDIESRLNLKIKGWKDKKSATDRLFRLIEKIPNERRFCLIFDEIEYISPNSKLAPHWASDFVPFWQALWSIQSQFRQFNFIIAGVNPSLSEIDRISEVQNPIFGIVKGRYLTGFEKPEVYTLASVLGKRMGLSFDETAVEFLFERYGGHPLLTRMICSQINNEIRSSGVERPVKITSKELEKDIEDREEEISFYCDHIVSELKEFYPIEYEMLELVAIGNIADFNELARDTGMVRHLKSYGLLDMTDPFRPSLRIPVLRRFIASKWQQNNNELWDRYVVPKNRRLDYVSNRLRSITRDVRFAEKRFLLSNLPSLYNGAGINEAERFATAPPATDEISITAFLNQANRSLVEPIDKEGERLGNKGYFFTEVKAAFPYLWDALNRVRAYRNYFMHIKLNDIAKAEFDRYLNVDLGGRRAEDVPDGFFRMQSAVLDGLIIGVQAELGRYE
jgi:hypothetical protein